MSVMVLLRSPLQRRILMRAVLSFTLLSMAAFMLWDPAAWRQPVTQSMSPASAVRVIGYACDEYCGGWADRQKGIVAAYVIATMLGKSFKIDMTTPCNLGFLLSPRETVDWRLQPGELAGRSVLRIRALNSNGVDFAKKFVEQASPLESAQAEYVFLTSNMNLVPVLRQHKLAQGITWLQELSTPDIYRKVLTELFTLMPGPRAQLDNFNASMPAETELICAQIRVGGQGDTESFNSERHLPGLVKFVSAFQHHPQHRFLFTSDKSYMIRRAQSYFPSLVVEMRGPVTHVDRSKGSDACGGFTRAILEQLLLSSCKVLVISESGIGKIAAFLRHTDQDLYIFHDGIVEKFSRESGFPNRVEW